MTEHNLSLPHEFTLNQRNHLTMTGVTEVVSFDDDSIVLRTDLGLLLVVGSGLKLKTLSPDGGHVIVEGKVNALQYEEPRPQRRFLSRFQG